MEGWIKLHRSLIKWEWFSDSKVSHLFLYILLNASHNEYKWKGKIFTKGQMPFGRDKASIETGLSIQSIRTALKKLELTNELTIESSRQGTVITVVNWDKYQGDGGKSTNKSTNEQPTSAYEWQSASKKQNRKASTFLTNWFESSFSKFEIRETYKQDILIKKLESMGFDSEVVENVPN